MAATAARNAHRPLIKIKLTGEGDLDRVRAVRVVLPETPIIVDANEGWEIPMVERFATELKKLQVQLVEQPLPQADDAALAAVTHRSPLCGRSVYQWRYHATQGRYDVINIKFDKTGGLTELKLRQAVIDAGMDVMVGCMVATSLSMAPASWSPGAVIADLDGPLLLAGTGTWGSPMRKWQVHLPKRFGARIVLRLICECVE